MMRAFVRWCGLLALGGLLLLSLASYYGPSRAPAFGGSPLSSHPMTVVVFSSSSSSVIGGPSLSAAFVNRLLALERSPAAGLGSLVVSLSRRYRLDDAFVLALCWHESHCGTTGEARVTFSPGNERCIADRPCIDRDRGGYAQMNSWADGFEHLYWLLWDGYVQGHINRDLGRVACPCTTVAQILPVFAPGSDGNDTAAYIADVEAHIAAWHAGRLWL